MFKNFAKPLSMRMLSLFKILRNICTELSWVKEGMYFCLSSSKTGHLAKQWNSSPTSPRQQILHILSSLGFRNILHDCISTGSLWLLSRIFIRGIQMSEGIFKIHVRRAAAEDILKFTCICVCLCIYLFVSRLLATLTTIQT